uniref:BAH domain-containing protein n=1 Tax=Ascaris lumbricoides TaxID=6252 RepID=A0A0M3HW19_ASCLU
MPAILSFKMHGVMPVIRHTRPPELTGMTHFHASMQNKSKMKLVSEAGAKYNVQGDSWRQASIKTEETKIKRTSDGVAFMFRWNNDAQICPATSVQVIPHDSPKVMFRPLSCSLYCLSAIITSSYFGRSDPSKNKRGKAYKGRRDSEYKCFEAHDGVLYRPGDHVFIEVSQCEPYFIGTISNFKMEVTGFAAELRDEAFAHSEKGSDPETVVLLSNARSA